MANNQVILTQGGLEEKLERLEYLRTVRRGEISQQIKEARDFGDLSENAEYDEAKNEQARVENEIDKLEKMLREAVVISEDDIDLTSVSIGATVRILDVEINEEHEYHIVGSLEADADRANISNESPVGVALMGHKIGDVVDVLAPAGLFKIKIIDIHK